ncbi:MAG: alkyl sulfatase dimerization domain-containing protein [Promethearchaeota archaeon]
MSGIQVITGQKVQFKNPLKDVHTAILPIAGCAWIDTTDGVVVIDTLISRGAAKKAKEQITGKVKYIIYTHGHMDHVMGTSAFMDEGTEVIASKYLPDRFDRYKMLAPYRAHISAVQFNLPEVVVPWKFVYPTKTFLGDMTIKLGDKTFELHTSRAETDDVCWVYIPELNAAFIGDLIIGRNFPNVGNPWKPTRFALDWAKTLEEVKALKPEYIFCSGASIMYKGEEAREAIEANIEVIRNLHDQVVDYINEGIHITEMIHKVKIPDHLKNNPYLAPAYSRPEFFTFNVYRWYHGYFDNNPAHLLPRPEKEVMGELLKLIGDSNKIIKRSEELFEDNQTQLALEILDIVIQTEPENINARKLRINLLKNLAKNDYCLMSRNAWVYYINKDKKLIRSKKDR